MKILYLHQYFKKPSEQGGTRSYDLAKSLSNMGFEIEIVTSTSNLKMKTSSRWNTTTMSGFTVHYLYLPYGDHLSYAKRILVFIEFLRHAIFKVLSLNADVLLATSTPLTIGIPALIKRMLHRTPYIFEVRDVWPEAVIAIGAITNKPIQFLLYLLENVIYKNSSAIVPLSIDMKKSIVTRYPSLHVQDIEVIENISEIDRFNVVYNTKTELLWAEYGISQRFTILYAGTFGKVNGIEYVIHLAEKILALDSSIAFVLVGDGAEKHNLVHMSKNRNVHNRNVYFLDPVPKGELAELYSVSSMGSSFVIPVQELWGNSANKYFDSFASAKPILINYGGWQAEEIKEKDVGYILPPRIDDINDKVIIDFINYTFDTQRLKNQSQNALKLAQDKYSLHLAVQKYIKVINRVLK
jgi:glycosyltransferase involved in cell wall biosynthesis